MEWDKYLPILFLEKRVQDTCVERALDMCKKILSVYSYPCKRKREKANAQAELNLPPYCLITETPTRWESQQQMIQRVLEQEKAISQVQTADRKTRHRVPNWQDVDVLESVNKTINPLIALSGKEYARVAHVKHVHHLLNNTVLPLDNTDLMTDMKRAILKDLNEKYADPANDDLLDKASCVNPCFRSSYIADE